VKPLYSVSDVAHRRFKRSVTATTDSLCISAAASESIYRLRSIAVRCLFELPVKLRSVGNDRQRRPTGYIAELELDQLNVTMTYWPGLDSDQLQGICRGYNVTQLGLRNIATIFHNRLGNSGFICVLYEPLPGHKWPGDSDL